ncbi:MAG: GGDEF domain-containing protein [Chromatiaceae bacterium]
MTPELERRLSLLIDFPSPAGVAAQVVNVANDPEADLGRVAQTVSIDPAMSAKMLRTANSPFYGQRRKSQNLRQAVMVLGLNATITLALGFSLVKAFEQHTSGGVDYPRFWRRALLSAVAARAVGEVKRLPYREEMFLAGLLQDIGILAIERSHEAFYCDLPRDARHDQLCVYERDRFGCDHAEVGAWLLRSWNIPHLLCDAVEASHRLRSVPVAAEIDAFMQCVALSGILADGLMISEGSAQLRPVSEEEKAHLQIDEAALSEIVEKIKNQIPETELLFERNIMAGWELDALMGRAREVLLMRSLDTLKEFQKLAEEHSLLRARTDELRKASSLDGLTGIFNRRYFDGKLQKEFEYAQTCHWPLSVLFADLDRFKGVNDAYGHQAGDEILRAAASLLQDNLRETDILARYGGEEFIVLLPSTDSEEALLVAERIVERFRANVHAIGPHRLRVTVSLGIATYSAGARFAQASDLVRAADVALYAAKSQGRDRVVKFDEQHLS